MPSRQAERVSDDQAVKEITGGNYAVKESAQLANDPLGIAVGENVSVETTEYGLSRPAPKRRANEYAVQTWGLIPSMASWLLYELILSLLNSRIP